MNNLRRNSGVPFPRIHSPNKLWHRKSSYEDNSKPIIKYYCPREKNFKGIYTNTLWKPKLFTITSRISKDNFNLRNYMKNIGGTPIEITKVVKSQLNVRRIKGEFKLNVRLKPTKTSPIKGQFRTSLSEKYLIQTYDNSKKTIKINENIKNSMNNLNTELDSINKIESRRMLILPIRLKSQSSPRNVKKNLKAFRSIETQTNEKNIDVNSYASFKSKKMTIILPKMNSFKSNDLTLGRNIRLYE